MLNDSMESSASATPADGKSQPISVPAETTITASEAEAAVNANNSLGNQISVVKETSTSGGASVSASNKASTHVVTNPVVPVKQNNSLIAASGVIKNASLASLRKLSEVDIKEIPIDSASDSQNGNLPPEAVDDCVMDFDDMNEDDSQLSELAASKTQYVCNGCGKGFCYIGWLDRHKLQSKACQNADKTEKVAVTNVTVTTASEPPISEAVSNLNEEYAKFGLTLKMDNSLSQQQRNDRQSLQGRLQELLKCPHPQCTFATYWLQSLTKHVNYTCKFGPVVPQTEIITSTTIATTTNTTHIVNSKSTAPVICTMCSKKCSDVQEHIDHMTSVHKMKASYRCSTCAQTFATKLAVEAHLQTHAKMSGNPAPNPSVHYSLDTNQLDKCKDLLSDDKSKLRRQSVDAPTTSIEIAEDEDDDTFAGQNEVFKCDCGKVYLQNSSYEQHVKTCKAVTPPDSEESVSPKRRSFLRARDIMDTSADLMNDLDTDHIKREQIREIHGDDFHCKSCLKEFINNRSLSSHIARSDCRDWYLKRILPEYMKNKDSAVYSSPNPNKRPRLVHETSPIAQTAHSPAKDEQKLVTSHSSDHPRRAASIAAQSTVKLSLAGHYVQSKEAPSSTSKRPMGTPIQCPKCFKIFEGKSPHVAYHNHLRSFKPCDSPDRIKKNLANHEKPLLQPKAEAPKSPIKNVTIYPHTKIRNLGGGPGHRNAAAAAVAAASSVPLEALQQGVKYYCKLCPNGEIKNRVSLGCHLTIYHGLPQVNVTTEKGDSFRCQTCCQVFVSKHYYNTHRYECDLTSPYVGVLNEDGTEATLENAPEQRRTSFQKSSPSKSATITVPVVSHARTLDSRSKFFSNSYKCSLCNKSGFYGPNAVKIHQKYQCIKRLQVVPAKPYTTTKKSFQNPQKIPVKPRIEAVSNVDKNGTWNQDEESAEGRMFMARMNDLAKEDATVTMCDACGRGPYNSYYYFLEHKKHFCRALKARKAPEKLQTTVPEAGLSLLQAGPRAVKTIAQRRPNIAKKSMATPEYSVHIPRQTARKSMNAGTAVVVGEEMQPTLLGSEEDEEAFEENIGVEPQDQIVKCSACGEEIENIEKFALHRLNHISQEINESASAHPLKCEICNAKISHYQRMQQHLILHLQNFTVIRQKNLTEVRRKKQMDDDSDDDEPLLTCPYCKANFVSRISLANHIRNSCPSRYQCPQCQRTYLTKESLMEHKEQCIRNAALRANSLKPRFKCRTCGLEFKVKQQLLWHEHACSKVYGADLAGRVEDIIQRTLTCGVCGMVSKDYENKLKHERRCLQRYLSDVGFRPPLGAEEDTFSDIELYQASDCDNLSSLKSVNEKLDEETIKMFKEKYGIFKDPKVLLKAEDICNYNEKLSDESDEEKLAKLKTSFESLLRVLLGEDVYEEFVHEDSAEVVLNRMLHNLGENPAEANGLSELTCFSQNLQTFLKLSIKEETLEKANHKAKSIEEVILNLLTFPYELK